jgi:hypothetical protein
VEGQQRRLLRLIIWGHLGDNFDEDALQTGPGLIGGWRGKVASQKMLLFYSDAELGCSEIDFHQNLFCSWLVGNGESYLKVGEDGSRAEEL